MERQIQNDEIYECYPRYAHHYAPSGRAFPIRFLAPDEPEILQDGWWEPFTIVEIETE